MSNTDFEVEVSEHSPTWVYVTVDDSGYAPWRYLVLDYLSQIGDRANDAKVVATPDGKGATIFHRR